MKEIKLVISDEDFNKLKKELVFNGTTEKLIIRVTEAWFTESPKFEVAKIAGEL